ncbi:hypothetical protein QYQ98_09005 [Corynebacterium sp. P3-F1]|uniref:divisome protein SepX/GlpR n=1 Tax=Corynebacterium sp. P3-F1 TaxID=3059080 RepID=UPI00265CD7B4|nr:gephyrin-like molybdotransferase receptor GlpR [Corynebacterium sp. P3-F1]WKK61145.1 hypothetical protein QYQ98_09005 [Corynebacterium sp. P3-F1]
MSGSLSLIIVLIVVVWAIVLAPMVFGDSKPIRRSGEGYDETRVLHQGTTPLQARRRPKVTKADIHSFDEENDYEVLDPVADEEEVLIDDASSGSTSLKKLFARKDAVDGEIVEEASDSAAEADSEVTAEQVDEAGGVDEAGTVDEKEPGEYELDDSFLSPEDYGYSTVAKLEESPKVAQATVDEDEAAPKEPTEDELAFARARRGRGGWDPETAKRVREDRFRRRQRTLLGLVVVFGVAFVFAIVSGGWAWLAPAAAAGLLVWYLTALRTTVKKERALHERRVRQLRRARLGVISAAEDAPVPAHMRRPGAVIVEVDDESADFANLPTYRQETEPIREIA